MRGSLIWVVMALVAVLLQGAAKIEDRGMGQSMKERVIHASSSIISISTDPPGYIYGGTRAKDGTVVYKVIMPPTNRVKVVARFADGSSAILPISYPLKWSPAQPAQVAAKTNPKTAAACCSGSQSSRPVYSPASPAASLLTDLGFDRRWELRSELIQDTRGLVTGNNIPGTMTQGNSSLRGTFQVSRGIGVFGEVAHSLSVDRSANWETTAYLGQQLAGFGGGLSILAFPRTVLSVGARYYVDMGLGNGAVNSPNLFTEVRGNDGRLYWDAKVSTNAFRDIGGRAELTARVHPRFGISVLGLAKRYASNSGEAQIGLGTKWYPLATDTISVGGYILSPVTNDAPPPMGFTAQLKF